MTPVSLKTLLARTYSVNLLATRTTSLTSSLVAITLSAAALSAATLSAATLSPDLSAAALSEATLSAAVLSAAVVAGAYFLMGVKALMIKKTDIFYKNYDLASLKSNYSRGSALAFTIKYIK